MTHKTITVDEDLHARLKRFCVERGFKISWFASMVLEEAMMNGEHLIEMMEEMDNGEKNA